MSKFRLALSLFLLFVTVQTAVAVSVPELDSLDRYIGLKKMFEGRKYARIDKEKRAVASRPSFSSYMKLGKEYTLSRQTPRFSIMTRLPSWRLRLPTRCS